MKNITYLLIVVFLMVGTLACGNEKVAAIQSKGDKNVALVLAIELNSIDYVKRVIKNGADVNKLSSTLHDSPLPIFLAVNNQNIEIVKFLLESGASASAVGGSGDTTLMIASHYGNQEMVNFLLALDKKPDINAVQKDGLTALILAYYLGHREVAFTLLEKGADISIPDPDGMTIMEFAIKKKDTEMIKILQDIIDKQKIE